MALLDKVVGAVIPPESEDARRKAREKAQTFAAGAQDWLGLILDHHTRIEAAFAAVAAAPAGTPRLAAFKSLALILMAHSNAEESVIYPALVRLGHEAHAMHAYEEQAQTKVKMAELEHRDPSGQPFLDDLDNIRGAVAHHMYEEESGRLLELKQLSAHDQETLTRRFKQEFERYLRSDVAAGADSDFPAARH